MWADKHSSSNSHIMIDIPVNNFSVMLVHMYQQYHQENMSVYCIPPYTPLLYSKTGVRRGIPIFLFLLQNIDCGYSLEPPRRGGSNVYPQSMF